MGRESCRVLEPAVRDETASPLVLVVDDESFMRLIFRTTLEEADCRVAEASSGEEAIDAFLRFRPDLVILDLVMPGLDGFETCTALRSLPEGRRTPILVVTGLNAPDTLHRALEAGATDFISKPINPDLLGYRVRYLMRAARALRELSQSEAELRLLKTAVESLPIGITISDEKGKIIYTNPSEAAMHGFEVEELLNREVQLLAPQQLHCSTHRENPEKYGIWRRESVNRRKSGEDFQVQLSSVSVHGPEGEFLGIVTTCEDITERKQNELKIHRLAYYDSLTGLPNRALFMDRLKKALAQSDRSEQPVAVLFLDLDNFKEINDTRGHDFGDRLLKKVAQRLSGCTRSADTLARLGGDEFVIILSTKNRETAGATARRILETFRSPFEIEGRLTRAGFSIGIALYPHDAPDLEGLLRHADKAMYQAKKRGRQNYQFFGPDEEQGRGSQSS